jgi:protein-S-isoprenylcysteine O-methyltransferase Ste14
LVKLVIFIVGTIGLVYFSWWASLKEKRFHGIYRFFGFESILALVLINANYWFENPLSPFQIVSWLFLLSCIFFASYGFFQFFKTGKPQGQMENTTVLISQGLYKYIRHPLYLSLILAALGAFFKKPSLPGAALAIVNIISMIGTAKVEEKEMLARFGGSYAAYMKTTKMFIPFLF